MIYFDNAATTGKKPENVIKAVMEALQKHSINPGRSGYRESINTAEEIYKVREKVASFFNCNEPQNVVFTPNCTQSINYVLKGVLNYGDHVVVSSLEHNAVMRPLLKKRNSYTVANVSSDDNVTVENFKKSIKPNTKLVFCTAASNVNGKILPLKKIGRICREKGVLFGVDAAQLAGVCKIDVKEMNIDFLCVAAHKGFYAPMGIGVLICEKNIPNTVIEGGTGTNSLEMSQPLQLPEKLESGTVNVPAIFGLSAGIDFVNKTGIEKIYNHEMELIQYIYKNLSFNPYVILYTPYPEKYEFAPVLSFNLKGLKSNETGDFLAKNDIAVRAGYHCAPMAHKQMNTLETGTVRISVSAFNSLKETDKFLYILNSQKK